MRIKTYKIINEILNLLLAVFVIGLIAEGIYIFSNLKNFSGQKETNNNEIIVGTKGQPNGELKNEPPPGLNIPNSVNLNIPFIVQAPLGDWSPPFNHSCEEAAVLTIHYFFQKEIADDPQKLSRGIQELADFEVEKYGFHEDTSAAQTARLIKDYYNYEAKVFYNISIDDIKKEVAKGNPVIVPAAGRLLNNPYFTPPGPVDHMLVIKGYNEKEIITNDPGTRRGADFVYSYQILEEAIRDYGQGSEGKKAMIVIYPPSK